MDTNKWTVGHGEMRKRTAVDKLWTYTCGLASKITKQTTVYPYNKIPNPHIKPSNYFCQPVVPAVVSLVTAASETGLLLLSISDGCTRCSSQCTLARSEKGHVTSCTPPGCQKMNVTLDNTVFTSELILIRFRVVKIFDKADF
ncbi:hypothetical protein OUZ56_016658 [Daphnia magna]|uniref:Uncharacterized protein n=1 Tax=Daphnia magna TaxID=35525 RepID=A0ABR0ARA5_9CRUS|nr:hypothetical protein OUZ56_016658 [Daphnia magna]